MQTRHSIEMCKNMKRTEKWVKARWEAYTKRKLLYSQINPKHWWGLVKE